MTCPELRYYKDGPEFNTSKNMSHNKSSFNHIVHEAPAPDAVPRADAKNTARMQKSSIHMFPNERDTDTFAAPAKRSAAAQNQFASSSQLYGTDAGRPAQKKPTAAKIAEIGGSDTVKPLSHGQTQIQKL